MFSQKIDCAAVDVHSVVLYIYMNQIAFRAVHPLLSVPSVSSTTAIEPMDHKSRSYNQKSIRCAFPSPMAG